MFFTFTCMDKVLSKENCQIQYINDIILIGILHPKDHISTAKAYSDIQVKFSTNFLWLTRSFSHCYRRRKNVPSYLFYNNVDKLVSDLHTILTKCSCRDKIDAVVYTEMTADMFLW